MYWGSIVCVVIVILGIVLFLYGANYYDAVVGWAGVFLAVGGFFAYVALKAYGAFKKGDSG